MNLIDKIDPKGYVIIKDKNGKILRANYNTIVNEGRRTILAKLLSNVLNKVDENSDVGIVSKDANYDFYALCLGKNTAETSINTTFLNNEYSATLTNGNINPFWFVLPEQLQADSNQENAVSEYLLNLDQDNNRYYISFTVRISPGSQIETDIVNEVCSLGIILKYSGDAIADGVNEYKLFSRFRFDAIPLTSESEFILSYYIYF